MLCAWVAIGMAFLFYAYLGPPRPAAGVVEGGATFPLIKEMANFVEPYLPPGFRTRLRTAAAVPARLTAAEPPPARQPRRTDDAEAAGDQTAAVSYP